MSKIKRRAVSNEQKEQRRQDILNSARALFESTSDYNALLMKHIAENIGLTKGTLYLYFKTKEEVFIALYSEELNRCFERLNARLDDLAPRSDVDAVADAISDVLSQKTTFLRLTSLLHSVLEQNIEYEVALEFKILLRDNILATGEKVETCLDLPRGSGAEILLSIHALAIGCFHMALPTPALDAILERPDMSFMKMDFEEEFKKALRLMIFAYCEKAKAG